MSTENLNKKEGIEKLREMVDQIDIGMMSSFSTDQSYPYVVPMSRQEVDEHGDIWYLFSSDSQSFHNFQADPRVSISFANPSNYEFLTLDGTVQISRDSERIEKYWNKFVEVYFEKGKEDPSIRVLQVTPKDAHYWDTKGNKLTNLLQVAASAITGQKMDLGREGDIQL